MSNVTRTSKRPGRARRAWLIALVAGIGLFVLTLIGHRAVDAIGARAVTSIGPLNPAGAVPASDDPGFQTSLAAATGIHFFPGNQIELLTEGSATLDRLEQDLGAARHSIVLQMYFCEPGRVSDRIKGVLIARARAGIPVLFLRDGFGCSSLGGDYSESLEAAGVTVAAFRPAHWYTLHRAQHRSHVRAIIIDGAVGYTGGFGLADKWVPDDGTSGWRDTMVRFTGPAVGQLASAFATAWAEATGALLADTMFPAADSARQGPSAGLLFGTWQYGTSVMERYLALSLAGARRRVFLTNPYFIPNEELRGWLKDAAGRGVDVRVLTAGPAVDVRWTRWAARTHYEELLEAGIRIYEYAPVMLHAKTMAVDGVVGSVGTLNLDNVSLRMNDETVLVVRDTAFTKELESAFEADLAQSVEIKLEQFRRRPWHERLRESVALFLRDFL